MLLRAGGWGERLEGTAAEDILLGGAGDDTLVAGGGDDHLHGGAGLDRALLPGAQDAYAFTREGARLVAQGPGGTVRLCAVEMLEFADAPGVTVAASEL
jgi:Ca2+-binding RTX toxin-like protein